MKTLLCLLLLLPSLAFGANAQIGQFVLNSVAIGTTPYTTTATGSATVTGSTFLLEFTVGSGGTVCTAIDNKSNTYSAPTIPGSGNPVHEVNDGAYIWVLQAVNGTGGASHTATITCNDNITSAAFIEVQNVPSSSPIDVSNSNYSTAGPPVNIPVTTTVANDLIVAGAFSAGGSSRAVTATGAGFTQNGTYVEPNTTNTIASLANATTGAHDPTWTRTGSVIAGITIAYKSSGGGASCTHSGITSGGAIGVPNGTTGTYQGCAGAFVTPDCSTITYRQTQGACGTN